MPPYQAIKTGDGIWCWAAPTSAWEKLCKEVLFRPELTEDARFLTNMDRLENIDMLEPLLEASFLGGNAEWIRRCNEARRAVRAHQQLQAGGGRPALPRARWSPASTIL